MANWWDAYPVADSGGTATAPAPKGGWWEQFPLADESAGTQAPVSQPLPAPAPQPQQPSGVTGSGFADAILGGMGNAVAGAVMPEDPQQKNVRIFAEQARQAAIDGKSFDEIQWNVHGTAPGEMRARLMGLPGYYKDGQFVRLPKQTNDEVSRGIIDKAMQKEEPPAISKPNAEGFGKGNWREALGKQESPTVEGELKRLHFMYGKAREFVNLPPGEAAAQASKMTRNMTNDEAEQFSGLVAEMAQLKNAGKLTIEKLTPSQAYKAAAEEGIGLTQRMGEMVAGDQEDREHGMRLRGVFGARAAGESGAIGIERVVINSLPYMTPGGFWTGAATSTPAIRDGMRRRGLSAGVADAAAPFSALLQSYIERTTKIPGVPAGPKMTGGFMDKLGVRIAKSYLSELSEENLQEGFNEAITEMAAVLDKDVDREKLGEIGPGRVLKEMWGATRDAVIPVLVMSAPGAAVAILQNPTEKNQQLVQRAVDAIAQMPAEEKAATLESLPPEVREAIIPMLPEGTPAPPQPTPQAPQVQGDIPMLPPEQTASRSAWRAPHIGEAMALPQGVPEAAGQPPIPFQQEAAPAPLEAAPQQSPLPSSAEAMIQAATERGFTDPAALQQAVKVAEQIDQLPPEQRPAAIEEAIRREFDDPTDYPEPEAKPVAPPAKSRGVKPQPREVDQQAYDIGKAAVELGGGKEVTRVRIADLAKKLNVPKAQLDAKLLEMERQGWLTLSQLDNPQEITQADRDAAVRTPTGNQRHILHFGGQGNRLADMKVPKSKGVKPQAPAVADMVAEAKAVSEGAGQGTTDTSRVRALEAKLQTLSPADAIAVAAEFGVQRVSSKKKAIAKVIGQISERLDSWHRGAAVRQPLTEKAPAVAEPAKSRGMKPKPTREALTRAAQDKLDEFLAKEKALPEDRREHYRREAVRIFDVLPDAALDRLSQGVAGYKFYADQDSLSKAAGQVSERARVVMDQGGVIAGFYQNSTKTLHLDWNMARDLDGEQQSYTGDWYAHEMAHAIDGPKHELSSSQEWQTAWKDEIANGSLSDYAKTTAIEGFAEFARLLYGVRTSVDVLRQTYPKATAYFESKGLLPVDGTSTETRVTEVFDKPVQDAAVQGDTPLAKPEPKQFRERLPKEVSDERASRQRMIGREAVSEEIEVEGEVSLKDQVADSFTRAKERDGLGTALKQLQSGHDQLAKSGKHPEMLRAIKEFAEESGIKLKRANKRARGMELGVTGEAEPIARPSETLAKLRRGLNIVASFFRARGDLPQEAFDAKVKRDGKLQAYGRDIAYTERDFQAALKEAYGDTLPTDEEWAAMDDALKGGPMDEVPEEVRPVIARMRKQIDRLSKRVIDSGAAEGEMVATIEKNKGTYVHRSYQVFDDPEWADKVDPEVKNRFKAWLRTNLDENLTDSEARAITDSILYEGKAAETPIALLSRSKLGSKDLSIFKERRALPDELRALLGEYRNPMVNYAKSVTKMASVVANHNFLAEVREAGLGKFFFDRDDLEGRDKAGAKTRLTAGHTPYMAPLDGLYTTPEIKKAFEDIYANGGAGKLLEYYLKMNGVVKWSKTVGSPVTHVRNLLSNAGFAIANGHWRLDKAGKAFQAVHANLLGTDADAQKYYRRLVELGVTEDDLVVSELRQLLKEANSSKADIGDYLADRSIQGRAARMAKKGVSALNDLYKAEDAVWKIYAFENEVARYSTAKPGWTRKQVEAKAAEIVRSTYPTYSMTGKAVQAIRYTPVVGTFVSFPAEVVRTLYHTAKLSVQEMADPELRHIGSQRAAGLTVAAVGMDVIAMAAAALLGFDDDDQENLARFVPPWSRNSSLMPLWRDGKGGIAYVDLGYTDPHSYAKRVVRALWRGDNLEEGALAAGWEALAPFVGEEILFGNIVDALRNKTSTGREIYSDADSPVDKMKKIAGHIGESFKPGGVQFAQRIIKGAQGEVSERGKQYNPWIEAFTISGFRIEELNAKQSLGYRTGDYQKLLQAANTSLTRTASNQGTVSDDDLKEAYLSSERTRQLAFDKLHRDIDAAIQLGVGEDEIADVLKTQGLSDAAAKKIVQGKYEPHVPTAEFLKTAAAKQGAKGLAGNVDFEYRSKLIRQLAEKEAGFVPGSAHYDENAAMREAFLTDQVRAASALPPTRPRRENYRTLESYRKAVAEFPERLKRHNERVADAREVLQRMEVLPGEMRRALMRDARKKGERVVTQTGQPSELAKRLQRLK